MALILVCHDGLFKHVVKPKKKEMQLIWKRKWSTLKRIEIAMSNAIAM